MKKIHIGQIIEAKFRESGLSIMQFAQAINRTRGTVYDIFARKSIDTDLLLHISEVLHYDFLGEYYPDSKPLSAPKTHYHIHFEVTGELDAKQLCEHLAQYKKEE